MPEFLVNREILIKIVTGVTRYYSDFLPTDKSVIIRRFTAFNDSSAGGGVRLGYRLGTTTLWISELTLTAQDILYGDDFTVEIPPQSRLVFDIVGATADDLIYIYLYGD